MRWSVARRVLTHFQPGGGAPRAADTHLTDRERQILDLKAEGWGNQAIARRLGVAPNRAEPRLQRHRQAARR